MGAVKNYYHDEICFSADVENADVGCPFKLTDPRAKDWLDGFKAALDWVQEMDK